MNGLADVEINGYRGAQGHLSSTLRSAPASPVLVGRQLGYGRVCVIFILKSIFSLEFCSKEGLIRTRLFLPGFINSNLMDLR